ncbi:hypothetical protein ACUXK4_004930 [Methylorubrum extorquens]
MTSTTMGTPSTTPAPARSGANRSTLSGPRPTRRTISPRPKSAPATATVTTCIVSPVAGDADVLVVPDLVSGNMLAKQLVHLAGA